jgi:branched-chain amino acid transport system substrate-binding protein
MRTTTPSFPQRVGRRVLLKAGLASAALQIASPFLIRARGEEAVKMGMVEPLTGVYAKLAKAEVEGARLAAEEVNQSGGILGRQAQLLVEDSANDIATGVAKTRQLIERDHVDFILGDVNSAVALAVMRVTAEKRKLHIVTGGHTDEITSGQCSWNVFRICKSATMAANAIADTLVEKFGKRWFFLTPDYAYGYSLQAAFQRKLRQHGGTWAGDTLPLGTIDYTDSLLKAGAYGPDVLLDLMGGQDQANSLEQIVRFHLEHDMAIAGALFELESILAVSDAARIGWWTMEWWWNQPDNPRIKAFDETIRRHAGRAASARDWFGYAAVHTLAKIADREKSLDPVVLARALQGYVLPADFALDPDRVFFRAGDHQLISTILVGEVHPPRSDPFDVFTVGATVKGDLAAGAVEASACRLEFPG